MNKNPNSRKSGKKRAITFGFVLTVVLGLLMLSWINPSIKAQQGGGNPQAGQENSNCITYSTNYNCPVITNNGVLNTDSFCVSVGASVPLPSLLDDPGVTNGQEIITADNSCTGDTTYTTNQITTSLSDLMFDPKPPSGDKVGVYTSDCYIYVIPSNTNCPKQKIDYGNITWHIIGCTNDNKFDDAKAILDSVMDYMKGSFDLGVASLDVSVTGIDASRQICTCCTGQSSVINFSISGNATAKIDLLAEAGIPAIHIRWYNRSIWTPFGYYQIYINADAGVTGNVSLDAKVAGSITNSTCDGTNINCQNYTISGTLGIGGDASLKGDIKVKKVIGVSHKHEFDFTLFSANLSGSAGINYNSCNTPNWTWSQKPCLNPATGEASFSVWVASINAAASVNIIPSIACAPVTPTWVRIWAHVIVLGDFNLYVYGTPPSS